MNSANGHAARFDRIQTSLGTVQVARAGSGRLAILLHGIGSSSSSFRHQIPDLCDEFRLVAWDAPGYAGSEDPVTAPGIDDFADCVIEVADALGAATFHLAGVSWGGLIATRTAIRHPNRLTTLTLIGSTPGRLGTATMEDLEARCRALEREGAANFARGRAKRVLSDDAPQALIDEVEANMAASIRPPGYRAAAETLSTTRHIEELAEVTAPTLVLVGSDDVITGIPESRALADGIAGSRLEVVEGAGHLVNQEFPETVNKELRRHWKGT